MTQHSLRDRESMTHLDLFSGIGGFALSAKWAGFETKQFVEIEPFCQKVLAKNFPGIPCHGDIRTFSAARLRGQVDLLTGGFPCQDVSSANHHGSGVDGARSGLFEEAVRIAYECRPRWIVLENVRRLETRGLDRVCLRLEEAGFSVWPHVLGAGNAGAPHLRPRFFVVAYAHADNEPAYAEHGEVARMVGVSRPPVPWKYAHPRVRRVDDGLRGWMDRRRLEALGNAVVPQQAYPIMAAIANEIQAERAAVERAENK